MKGFNDFKSTGAWFDEFKRVGHPHSLQIEFQTEDQNNFRNFWGLDEESCKEQRIVTVGPSIQQRHRTRLSKRKNGAGFGVMWLALARLIGFDYASVCCSDVKEIELPQERRVKVRVEILCREFYPLSRTHEKPLV